MQIALGRWYELIGIYEWERETKQTVVLDIEMAFDIQKAAETDDIQYTLDYKTVSKRIISFVEASQFFLVEKLISEIAGIIRNEFNGKVFPVNPKADVVHSMKCYHKV